MCVQRNSCRAKHAIIDRSLPSPSSHRADAFAMVLVEMATRAKPFAVGETRFDPRAVMAGTRPDVPDDACPRAVRRLMGQLWAEPASARPSFSGVVARLKAAAEERAEQVSVHCVGARRRLLHMNSDLEMFEQTLAAGGSRAAPTPKVFGGGTACLERTGDDLLDTGVAIMARPPGKKNSTIHLLSGGEKAMTAIALVFSIFQLNPAPFCMLDEVDAPLDDANVGRYARLVSEMSKKVQFVFITHNKITMEAAEQLMGVTMHEPGVSRLVTVDIEEAARLAAS